MKKKELLIIFVLAVLVTWGSGFISHPEPGCGSFPDALCGLGWPLVFHRLGGIFGVDQWLWLNLLLGFLFWFLVLALGWWGMKLVLRSTKSKSAKEEKINDRGKFSLEAKRVSRDLQSFLFTHKGPSILVSLFLLTIIGVFAGFKIFSWYSQEVVEPTEETPLVETPSGVTEEKYCQGRFLEDCAGKVVKVQGILRSGEELILESPTTPSKHKNVYLEPYWIGEGFVDEKVEVIGRVVAGSVFPCLEEAKIQPPVTRTKDPISGKITCTAPTFIRVESIKLPGVEEVPYLDVAAVDLTPEYDKKRVCLYGEYSVGFEHQGFHGDQLTSWVWTRPAFDSSYTMLSPQEASVKGQASYHANTIACGLLRYSSEERKFGFGHMGMYPYLLNYNILIVTKGEKPSSEKIENQDDCQKIQGKARRAICFWDLAWLNSDPNICQSIGSEEIKSICFLDLAKDLSNPQICDFAPTVPQEKIERILQKAAYTNYSEEEMQGTTMQDFCHAESEPKELSWCEKINPIGVKEQCLAAVAKNTGVESICDQIDEYTTKRFCYAEVVVKKDDLSVCEKLPGITFNPDGSITYPPEGEDLMGGCFWAYALLTGDRNVCDQVKDPNSQKVCRNAVGS